MISHRFEHALMDVGFTENEARIYIALLNQSPLSVYAAALGSGVNRSCAYMAVEGLMEKGFIRQESGATPTYVPAPVEEILAEQQAREEKTLRAAAAALSGVDSSGSRLDSVFEFYGYEDILSYTRAQIQSAHSGITLLVRPSEYAALEDELKAAVERGVLLRVIGASAKAEDISCPFATDFIFFDDQYSLEARRGNRWLLACFDDSEALLGIVSRGRQSAVVATSNCPFVAIVRDFLDQQFAFRILEEKTGYQPYAEMRDDWFCALERKLCGE